MYSYRKRITALILAMTLALSLTACGDGDTKKKDPGKNDSKGEDLSSTVYTTEVKELTIGDKQIYAISSQDVAAVGKDIYFFAYTYSSGEEDEGMYPEIFHVDAETGEIRELEGFAMPAAEDADTNFCLDGVAAGADGTIWIGVTVNKAIFELPTDFDEEKDDRWKYYKGSERKTTWHQIDDSGNEIAAGNVPDMLVTNTLPISQYMARGLFEDLWPYIDNDPELSRDQLMIRPLEAAQVDGKLPQVYDDFINWSTGECYYDSQEFIDILKFCDQYGTNKEDVNWNALEDEASVIGRGMQLLMLCELNDLQSMQVEQAAKADHVIHIEDGRVAHRTVMIWY